MKQWKVFYFFRGFLCHKKQLIKQIKKLYFFLRLPTDYVCSGREWWLPALRSLCRMVSFIALSDHRLPWWCLTIPLLDHRKSFTFAAENCSFLLLHISARDKFCIDPWLEVRVVLNSVTNLFAISTYFLVKKLPKNHQKKICFAKKFS